MRRSFTQFENHLNNFYKLKIVQVFMVMVKKIQNTEKFEKD